MLIKGVCVCVCVYIYTSSQMFLNSEIYNVFILFCSPSLHLFDPKYSKSSDIMKQFYYLK